MIRKGLLLFGLAILACSCGVQPIEKFDKIKDMTWKVNEPSQFTIDIKDTGRYLALIQLRYTQNYSFSNIWVGLNEKKPDGKEEKTRFNIPLFDLSGRPFGASTGKLFDRGYPDDNIEGKDIGLTFQFPKPGPYVLTLTQQMRPDELPGIAETGIRLVKLK